VIAELPCSQLTFDISFGVAVVIDVERKVLVLSWSTSARLVADLPDPADVAHWFESNGREHECVLFCQLKNTKAVFYRSSCLVVVRREATLHPVLECAAGD
jgi:hypothetical protein